MKCANCGTEAASAFEERSRFETFLAHLSAAFIGVPADQVDSQIVAGLRQIVEFLGIDRSGFGELVAEQNKMVITHSYEVPGVPPTPRIYVEARWPDYASKVQQGEPFRVPEDLPAEATAEREFPMREISKALASFLRDESGPTAVEYAVMLALIIVVCITAPAWPTPLSRWPTTSVAGTSRSAPKLRRCSAPLTHKDLGAWQRFKDTTQPYEDVIILPLVAAPGG